MLELRKDYILDRWVIISSERDTRPMQFKQESQKKPAKDFFAPGNEEKTPPEIGRVSDKGKWKIRWFENKFPFARMEGQQEIRTDNKYFTFSSAYGKHEIIVETPDDRQMWDYSKDELCELMHVYAHTVQRLEKEKGIKYVQIFKNQGEKGGASIQHAHTQVGAVNIIPKEVRDKIDAAKRYESCPYCEIIWKEREGLRKCFENDNFLAFTPYASRFNYEVWILPKQHLKRFRELDYNGFCEILQKILLKLKEINVDYNIIYHYSPDNENLHFQAQILPRISNWAGFEFGTGIVINTVSPEDAAKFYRES